MKQGKGNTINQFKKKKEKNRLQNRRNKIESKRKEKKKLIVMKKNHTWKRMRFVLFLQTSNLHLNKQKIKS
jgi:hypothetical protein